MQVNAIHNYNNQAAKAQFGSVAGFGQGLLNRVSSSLLTDPPKSQMLVLPLANGDQIVLLDIDAYEPLHTQVSGTQTRQIAKTTAPSSKSILNLSA